MMSSAKLIVGLRAAAAAHADVVGIAIANPIATRAASAVAAPKKCLALLVITTSVARSARTYTAPIAGDHEAVSPLNAVDCSASSCAKRSRFGQKGGAL